MVSTYRDMCGGVMESKIFIVYHDHGPGGAGKMVKEKKAWIDTYTFVVVFDMIFSPNYQKWLIGHRKLVTITSLTYIRHVLGLWKTHSDMCVRGNNKNKQTSA